MLLRKNKNQFQFVSFLRADLCGGSLDIWPLYLILNHCKTLQLSLSLKTKVFLELTPESSHIQIKVLNKNVSFSSQREFLKVQDKSLSLIQEVVRFFKPSSGFHLEVFSESPLGGGLGGSSSVLAGLVKCFSSERSLKFSDLIFLCRDLEAQVLKAPTGLQDYVVPLMDISPYELSRVHFKTLNPEVKTQKASSKLRQHLLLIHTGIEHHSGQTNNFIIQRALKGENLSELKVIRDISLEMETVLLKNKIEEVPKLFQKELEIRKKIVMDFPQKVEELIEFLYSQKVLAVKQMGAGSGGSLLLWTSHKEEVKNVCQKKNLLILEEF